MSTPADPESSIDVIKEHESEVRSYARSFPAVFERATGAQLHAQDGGRYLDFLMGCSSLNYGHNPPTLKKALIDFLVADGITHSLDLFSGAKSDFLEGLQRIVLRPRDLDYVVQFPGPTGTNAVEAALKLARKVTGRKNVIAFTNGFHGVTLGALACTGNAHHRGGAGLELNGITRMPFDGYLGADVDTSKYLEQVLSDPSSGVDAPAAVIVETVQGEGGLNVASASWLRAVARVARRHGALFIVDDIQAGVGRTGSFFSFEPAGVKPDIVTLAKSISGYGLPLALVLIKPEFDQWQPGEHNGTFRGNCPAFVTALAALETYWADPDFEAHVQARGRQLEARIKHLCARFKQKGVVSKGRGMMRGIALPNGETAAAVTKIAFERGLLIETSGSNDEVVKCLAPLTIDEAEFDRGLDILQSAVTDALSSADRAAA